LPICLSRAQRLEKTASSSRCGHRSNLIRQLQGLMVLGQSERLSTCFRCGVTFFGWDCSVYIQRHLFDIRETSSKIETLTVPADESVRHKYADVLDRSQWPRTSSPPAEPMGIFYSKSKILNAGSHTTWPLRQLCEWSCITSRQ